ncbi:MAG: hypothetical protein FWD18_01250 [Micrococcales bacterium]|nr:hypothetical protein [Micrococcales bacterium]
MLPVGYHGPWSPSCWWGPSSAAADKATSEVATVRTSVVDVLTTRTCAVRLVGW